MRKGEAQSGAELLGDRQGAWREIFIPENSSLPAVAEEWSRIRIPELVE
jgi:hypothetical protein